ncbi:MAG: rod shape-determining protein MreC [Phycisphaerales bacterium]|nr:MAG: rod shape-determining protein MreC [Phycisphaerales bacterium]
MTRYGHKTSKRMLFAYCMLGGGIFLFTPPSVTGKLQLAYARVFRGPLETGHDITLAGRIPLAANTVDSADYTRLMTIQRRLRNHVANLQAQLDEAHRQIDTLAGLRSVPELNRMKLQPAGIINDPGETQTILLVNRGQKDGLAAGQFVIGDYSVIGVVSDVSAQTARVKLITDPTSKLPVRIARIEAKGVMRGRGPGEAVIPEIYAKNPPKVGDQVYGHKTPGFPGVPIVTAEVVESKRSPDNARVWEITVRPVCDIANLPEIHVVIPGK